MFTLVTDKSPFYRIKRGQSAEEVEKLLSVPCGEAFCGAIIAADGKFYVYSVKPCETYRSIAEKLGVSRAELEKINFSRPLYPTQRLFVPCN